ncbi:hypothetical protein BOTBODRAFT_249243 [Botryobasidium botryosum FD-172 SS1]|uniref:Uncharacterized protein n=1 Tax=Botryobasidium botryosum (strain FD-172 SS1) TaxID=930990 RepID=A0A067ML19_BOTB1|nr:hypothetical protein BOTBODRAFT_249243 [Botryobasidium botryosum FD-172 SS1]
MSPPLQILSVGCAAVIIAAKAFWMHPGDIRQQDITVSAEHYMQSSTADHVRLAVLEAFQDAPSRWYNTSEGKAALLGVVLNNQMSHAS